MAPHNCPHCGKPLDSAAALAGQTPAPKPDDFAVCLDCGGVSAYVVMLADRIDPEPRLGLRKLTPIEETEAACDPDVIAIRRRFGN